MLQSLRNQSQSFLIYLLFGILIIVFVFMFGLPTDSCNPQTRQTVAEAGDHEIDEQMLRSTTLRVFRDQFRGSEAEFLAAQRQVLSNMITVFLISDIAEEAGIRVSDEELRLYLVDWEQGNPDAQFYMVNGQFDKDAYSGFLARFGTNKERYEKYKRRELMARNYLTLLESSIVVSEREVRQAFEDRTNRKNVSFAKLYPASVEHLFEAPSDADVSAFLADNMDAVKARYEEDSDEYNQEPTVHLRQIVIQKRPDMLREKGTETDEAKSPEERFEIVKDAVLDKKMDWVEAAEKYNEAIYDRLDGGDLRTRELSKLPSDAHREAIADKKVGDIVTFESEFTYNVVEILDRTDGVERKLDEVQRDIAAELLGEERAEEKLAEVTEAIRKKAAEGTELQKAVDEVLYANLTPPTEAPDDGAEGGTPTEDAPTDGTDGTDAAPAEGDAAPGGNEPAEQPTAEGNAGDGASGEDAGTAETDPADAPGAEEEADEAGVETEAAESNWVPEDERVKVDQTGLFSPQGGMGANWAYLPRIGENEDLARAVQGISESGAVVPEVYVVDGAHVVAVVAEVQSGTDEEFANQRDMLEQQLRSQKSLAMLGNWQNVIRLRHGAPTEENPYGPWLQVQYDKAFEAGRFTINEDYFVAPPETEEPQPGGGS